MSNTPKVNRDAGFHSQDNFKHSGGKPGGKIPGNRPVKVTGRDPRAGGAGPKVRNPNRAYG
jgi:hypothetical protein